MANICPCKGCVPPKRTSTCHSTCQDYIMWSAEHQARLNAIHEAKRHEQATNPRVVWKARNNRRNRNGNN